jgi:hypothetical protein
VNYNHPKTSTFKTFKVVLLVKLYFRPFWVLLRLGLGHFETILDPIIPFLMKFPDFFENNYRNYR